MPVSRFYLYANWFKQTNNHYCINYIRLEKLMTWRECWKRFNDIDDEIQNNVFTEQHLQVVSMLCFLLDNCSFGKKKYYCRTLSQNVCIRLFQGYIVKLIFFIISSNMWSNFNQKLEPLQTYLLKSHRYNFNALASWHFHFYHKMQHNSFKNIITYANWNFLLN